MTTAPAPYSGGIKLLLQILLSFLQSSNKKVFLIFGNEQGSVETEVEAIQQSGLDLTSCQRITKTLQGVQKI